MNVVVITPPLQVISLELAKKHLRATGIDDDDDIINVYIAAAQGALDGPDGCLGRAIGLQTLELRKESFGAGHDWQFGLDWIGWEECDWSTWAKPRRFGIIELPYPPLVSITSVIYEDLNGVDQVLDASGWQATDDGVTPAFGDVWPTGRITANAVRIQYQAGYAPLPAQTEGGAPISTIPGTLIAAMLLMIGDLYSNSDGVVIGQRAAVIENPTVKRLLAPYQKLRV